MSNREIGLVGVFFAFIISFSVYGKIEETRKERDLVKELIEVQTQENINALVPLAKEYKKCLQAKKEYDDKGFEFDICNRTYEGIEERWEIVYETNIDGGFLLKYKYADVDGIRVYECEEKWNKLNCQRVE